MRPMDTAHPNYLADLNEQVALCEEQIKTFGSMLVHLQSLYDRGTSIAQDERSMYDYRDRLQKEKEKLECLKHEEYGRRAAAAVPAATKPKRPAKQRTKAVPLSPHRAFALIDDQPSRRRCAVTAVAVMTEAAVTPPLPGWRV